MMRDAAWLTIFLLLGGCTLPHQDAVMQGNATGVVISFAGADVAETLPLARQFCARYERVPSLRKAQENNAYYACLPPGTAPPAATS